MKIWVVIGIVVVFIIVLAFVQWTRNFFAIDDCLDQGGRWNKATLKCELY